MFWFVYQGKNVPPLRPVLFMVFSLPACNFYFNLRSKETDTKAGLPQGLERLEWLENHILFQKSWEVGWNFICYYWPLSLTLLGGVINPVFLKNFRLLRSTFVKYTNESLKFLAIGGRIWYFRNIILMHILFPVSVSLQGCICVACLSYNLRWTYDELVNLVFQKNIWEKGWRLGDFCLKGWEGVGLKYSMRPGKFFLFLHLHCDVFRHESPHCSHEGYSSASRCSIRFGR